MTYLVSSIKGAALKAQQSSLNASIFLALLLFGQVFFSTLAYFFGVENRLFILPFRGLMALYSLYVVLINIVANKSRFLDGFPLSLVIFWFVYFARLLIDYFLSGVAIALPIWEFFVWGIGGCLLPSLYFVVWIPIAWKLDGLICLFRRFQFSSFSASELKSHQCLTLLFCSFFDCYFFFSE